MDISIDGLTRRQVMLLDKMWSIKGVTEYEEWKADLPLGTMNIVDSLEQLVVWAELDDITYVSDATRALKIYRIGGQV